MPLSTLKNKRVAVIVTDGFEQSEYEEPVNALKKQDAEVTTISLKKGKIKAWKDKNWSDEFNVDLSIDDASPENFDALVLPGGVMNPDKLRQNQKVVSFVKQMFDSGKPIAAICHGPWLLAEAGIVKNKKVTSYPSLKTDLINAGANWVNEEVVVDNGVITSRNPDDLPAFCKKVIEEIKEGIHA